MSQLELNENEFNEVAQNGHLLAGSTLVFACLDLYPPALWYLIGIFAALTAWKEFVWDQHNETAEVRGSNLNDWLHYQIGWIVSLGIHFATHAWLVYPK